MRESKDKIKSRMLRNAASIWGFQEPQSESSFDPLVSLLLGACAYELEKISSEINNTESRIIERMVNLLTPHPITSSQPAYAVAFAKPYKTGAKVGPNCQFFNIIKVNDTYGKKSEDKQIFFGPTGTFNLTNGRVRYIAANKVLYEIVDNQYKDIITERFKTPIPSTQLFIGIELEEKPDTLTLFFDLISEHLKQTFYSDLENCQWKMGDEAIDAQKGIKDLNRRDHDINQMIHQEVDLSTKISNYTNSYFNRQFITLDLKNIKRWDDAKIFSMPSTLASSIDSSDLQNIEENTVWFEMKFSRPLSNEVIENMVCSLNCFPVINKKLNEYTGSARELINIIPLHTDDIFFDLKSVTNSDGEAYRTKHFINQGELSKGSALLRPEGVGRFDSRSAMEYLDYLMELLKEESAAFNVIGSDMIASNLKELNQAIARLEKKMEDIQLEKGDTAYLMLKPHDGDRQVFVEYWSTNGTLANNIRTGSALNVYQADDIDYNASRLMSTTTGGKEKPNTEARLNTYRRWLQSGDRVVTTEDIRALCFEFFGESISHVRVEKGVEKGSLRTEGFIRTINIYLSTRTGQLNIMEQNSIRQELLIQLESRSSNIFPFRIYFENSKI